LFSVLVGYETLAGPICELANGTVVAPGSLVRWLDEAWVERVVFEGPSRVMDVGAATRTFTGATRRAVEVRDRQCFHDLCEEPAERCQIDHIQPWAEGGPTVAANGRPACAFHNRSRAIDEASRLLSPGGSAPRSRTATVSSRVLTWPPRGWPRRGTRLAGH
jgi:hypothetical protein